MSEISSPETFTSTSPDKTVTAARLNNHVNGATILVGSITEKDPIATATAAGDLVAVADVSDGTATEPRKVTLANLLPEAQRHQCDVFETGVFAGSTYTVTLAPAALAHTAGMVVRFRADTANGGGGTLLKVNALASKAIKTRTGAALVAGDIPQYSTVTAIYDAGSGYFVVEALIGNDEFPVAKLLDGSVPFAKLDADFINSGVVAAKTTPTRADTLLLGDAADTNLTKCASIAKIQDAGSFASTAISLSNGAFLDTAHSLGGIPASVRGVLVCQSADGNYTAADEINVTSIADANDKYCAFIVGASATNVFMIVRDTTKLHALNKSGGGDLTLDAAKWKGKVYAHA